MKLFYKIVLIFLISPGPLYSSYCDDGDIINYFYDGIWKLDLNVYGSSNDIEHHQFLFTFEQRSTNSLKLSRSLKFPKIISSAPKRIYSAKKMKLVDGTVDVSPIRIEKFSFKQTGELTFNPLDANGSQRNLCVYEMNIDGIQQNSSDDDYEYNAKYRLIFHAGEMWQNKSSYLPLAVEPTSIFFEYNDIQGEADNNVTGSIRRVEYSD